MDNAEIENRFSFHPATPETGPKHDEVRAQVRTLAHWVNENIADGRNKSLAMTALEDVMMRCNAAIATGA